MVTQQQTKSAPADSTAVIYLRIGADPQIKRTHDPASTAIPAQREACVGLAKKLGATIAGEFVESVGTSRR